MGSENTAKASLHEHKKLRPDIGGTSRVPATGWMHETGVLAGQSEPVVSKIMTPLNKGFYTTMLRWRRW